MKNKPARYERRVVLFLDILGFRALTNRNNGEQIYKLFTGLNKLREKHFSSAYGSELTMLSDSIVLSVPLDPHAVRQGLREGFDLASHFAYIFLEEGVLTRGGLTIGDIYHNENVVFGPALNRAYELESELAKYPRIIIDDCLRTELMSFVKSTVAPYGQEQVLKLIRQDFDGLYHVDIFRGFSTGHNMRLINDEPLKWDYHDCVKRVMAGAAPTKY